MSVAKKLAAFLAAVLLLLSVSGVAFADNRETVVFVTSSGTKYHTGDCGYLWNSCYICTLEEAVSGGLTACSRCHPPLPDFPVSATPIPIYESSSSSSSKPNYRATPSSPYRRSPSTTVAPQKQLEKRWRPTMREIMICIAVTAVINWLIAAVLLKKWRKADAEELTKSKDEIERRFEWEWSHREKELKENADEVMRKRILDVQKETIKTTATGMVSMMPDRYGVALPPPPSGSRIAADGLPGSDGEGKWGEVYTFYVSQNGEIFHRSPCGSMPWNRTEINAFNLLNNNRYRPCLRCCPKLPDMSWYEEYVKAVKVATDELIPKR